MIELIDAISSLPLRKIHLEISKWKFSNAAITNRSIEKLALCISQMKTLKKIFLDLSGYNTASDDFFCHDLQFIWELTCWEIDLLVYFFLICVVLVCKMGQVKWIRVEGLWNALRCSYFLGTPPKTTYDKSNSQDKRESLFFKLNFPYLFSLLVLQVD